VIAGSSYAGLHVALRLATKLRDNPGVELTLVDRHDYHQTLTELPQIGAGTHAADAVRIPPQRVMRERVGFVETEVIGFDLAARALQTKNGSVGSSGWCWPWAPGPTTSPSRAWASVGTRASWWVVAGVVSCVGRLDRHGLSAAAQGWADADARKRSRFAHRRPRGVR
jgi:hypothetical protein